MNSQEKSKSDSHSSQLLLSESEDIENVLALNSDYIKSLASIENSDLSALIDNLEVLEDLQLQDVSVDSLERNLSDALSYLKNLESSQTQTNSNSYNHDSEVVDLTDDYDKENSKCPLEVEHVEQGLENISEINENNGKIVTRSQDGAEYDNERAADDKIDSKCTPRIEYIVNYLEEEDINMKYGGNRAEIECNTQQPLAGELTEIQAANNIDIPNNDNLEVVYVIVTEEIENVRAENIEDEAEKTESIEILAGTVNENNTQDKDTDDTPMTKMNSQVPVDYNSTTDNEANINFASESETRLILRKEEEGIPKVKNNNSEKNEKTSEEIILQGKDSIVDFVNIIIKHIISLKPKELEDVIDDFQIAYIGNNDPAKSHTTLPCERFDVPEPATNLSVAIKEELNISTNNEIENDKRPNTAAEISKTEDMLLKASVNQNGDVKNPNMTPYFNSEAKEDLIESISLTSKEDDDSDGYHSSDFEIITENDAALHGLIINKPKSFKKLDFSKEQDCTRPTNRQRPLERHDVAYNYRQFRQSWNLHSERANILNQAGPSNPQTLTRSYYQARYANASNRWMDSCNTSESDLAEDFESLEETTRTNHVMPQREDYERLFQEMQIPMPTRLMENKSTHYRGVGGMQIEDNGPGFDAEANESYMNMYPEYRPEANRTLDLILEKYPEENTSPRRRRRN